MEPKKPKTYNLDEIRKIYPRVGLKWDKEEDERLKKLYLEHRAVRVSDFDVFVSELTVQFQRAAGGLKARMAMHFDNVPGWDYGRQEQRQHDLNKLVEEKISEASNAVIVEEYQKYLASKKETYVNFLRRLSQRIGE